MPWSHYCYCTINRLSSYHYTLQRDFQEPTLHHWWFHFLRPGHRTTSSLPLMASFDSSERRGLRCWTSGLWLTSVWRRRSLHARWHRERKGLEQREHHQVIELYISMVETWSSFPNFLFSSSNKIWNFHPKLSSSIHCFSPSSQMNCPFRMIEFDNVSFFWEHYCQLHFPRNWRGASRKQFEKCFDIHCNFLWGAEALKSGERTQVLTQSTTFVLVLL